MLMDVREYIDRLHIDGHTIGEDHDDDPILIDPAGPLGKPSDCEQGQWYFKRYVQHLPTEGEMVLFDRSWYNRAGVERVMGFAGNTELQARINAMRHFLSRFDCDGKDTEIAGPPDPLSVQLGIDAVGD